LDVAKKILILARCAGYNVSRRDMIVEPLIDEYLGTLERKIFLKRFKKKYIFYKSTTKS